MKRNKIAAAALALALATPVVANAASTTTDVRNSADFGSHGTGNYVITEDFRKYETEFVKAWKAYVAAQEALTKAEANEKAAKEAYDNAVKALNDYRANWKAAYDKLEGAYNVVNRQKDELKRFAVLAQYEGLALGPVNTVDASVVIPVLDYEAPKAAPYIKKIVKAEKTANTPEMTYAELQALVIEYNTDVDAYNALAKNYNELYSAYTLGKLTLKVEETKKAYVLAQEATKSAKAAKADASAKYQTAKKNFILAGMNRNVIDEAEKRGDLSLVTTTTKTTTTKPVTKEETTEKVEETVKPGTTTPAKKGLTAAQKAALEKAIADAEVQIQAVKFLKETTPKTIAKVADKLDKLVAEQEARLVKAKAILDADKVAISDILFSTAYAAEETEDVDALIKEINDSTEEIKDTLKANEEAQPEVKEEEKKPEDKKEEKKEETKVIEKTVVKPASTNKSAGSNAKTGIAGVAGVAGVLAAASVAYAASKKN